MCVYREVLYLDEFVCALFGFDFVVFSKVYLTEKLTELTKLLQNIITVPQSLFVAFLFYQAKVLSINMR